MQKKKNGTLYLRIRLFHHAPFPSSITSGYRIISTVYLPASEDFFDFGNGVGIALFQQTVWMRSPDGKKVLQLLLCFVLPKLAPT